MRDIAEKIFSSPDDLIRTRIKYESRLFSEVVIAVITNFAVFFFPTLSLSQHIFSDKSVKFHGIILTCCFWFKTVSALTLMTFKSDKLVTKINS